MTRLWVPVDPARTSAQARHQLDRARVWRLAGYRAQSARALAIAGELRRASAKGGRWL